MKQKKIVIVALVLTVIAIISGCGNGRGLNYDICRRGDALREIMVGVKSNKTDFKIDEITLDFYYGSEHGISGYRSDSDLMELGVGVYLCNAKDFDPIYEANSSFGIENYKDIDGLYFVRFIDMGEYNSTEYNVKLPFPLFGTPKYNHKETLTIPASIIDREKEYRLSTYFCLIILRIVYNKAQSKCSYDHLGYLGIEYEFLDDETVRLSEPGCTLF
ncbi:MAG: hypothetical protein J1F36_04255 [Clostridiales bacterium]|nr:hypothetical protein [Clostridiales bacterium]